MSIMFILGAGASVDSGLPVYRGTNGMYTEESDINRAMSSRESYNLLRELVGKPGPTYEKISEMAPPGSFILTQNIDGLAKSTGLDTIEIHLRNYENKFENVVLLGDNLPKNKVAQCYVLIAKRRPKWIVIIGTTLQFPYLRTFINKAKQRGGRVVHINPDENYKGIIKKEIWIQESAKDGLDIFKETYLNQPCDVKSSE